MSWRTVVFLVVVVALLVSLGYNHDYHRTIATKTAENARLRKTIESMEEKERDMIPATYIEEYYDLRPKLPHREASKGNYPDGCWVHCSYIKLGAGSKGLCLDAAATIYRGDFEGKYSLTKTETAKLEKGGYVYLYNNGGNFAWDVNSTHGGIGDMPSGRWIEMGSIE